MSWERSIESSCDTTGSPDIPRVSLVIPTLNEAENLRYVLSRLPRDLHEVVLVDGKSIDGTVEVARALCPRIRIVSQSSVGKGGALAAGFAACTGDIIVTLDADGSSDPSEIPLFVATLLSGADFAKGSRFLHGAGSADITRFRSLGNRFFNVLVNRLYRTRFTDLCYGFNAFWSRHLDVMDVNCNGFEVETLMNVRAAKHGLRIREVPSYEHGRLNGVSNLNAFRDGWRVLKTILAERRGGLRPWQPTWRPMGEVQWDGIEQRSGVDRRREGAGRGIPRSLYSRRRHGRRAQDQSVTPVALSTYINSYGDSW